MQPDISIIMPVYNVEKYLRKSIDSVLSQTYRNIEVILIDDGAGDRSKEIADEYLNKDSRVKVIHQDNKGAGIARNAGIKAAKGGYIGFVDSDDWVDEDMFENLYLAARKYDCDIVMCGCVKEDDNNRILDIVSLPIADGCYEKEDADRLVLKPMIGIELVSDCWKSIINSIWKNLYRREMLLKNNIEFLSERIIYAEDLLFNINAFYFAQRLYVINKPFYHYRKNISSITSVYRPELNETTLELNVKIKEFAVNHNLECSYGELLKNRLVGSLIALVLNAFRPGNNVAPLKKYTQIRQIFGLSQLQGIMKGFSLKGLPLKRKICYFLFKYKLIVLIYIYFTLKTALNNIKKLWRS